MKNYKMGDKVKIVKFFDNPWSDKLKVVKKRLFNGKLRKGSTGHIEVEPNNNKMLTIKFNNGILIAMHRDEVRKVK